MEWIKQKNLTTLAPRDAGELLNFVERPDWKERAAAYGQKQSAENESTTDWDLKAGYRGALGMANGSKVWEDGAAKLSTLTDLAGKSIKGMVKGEKSVYSEAGGRPFIPRAAAGDPRCMIRRKPGGDSNRPGLSIIINRATPGYIKAESMLYLSAAATAFSLVMQQRGYRVRTYYGKINMQESGKGIAILCPLISPETPFNMARLAFFGAHPAANRRIGFRAVEMGGDATSGPGSCYGWNYRPNERGQKTCFEDIRNALKLGPADKLVTLPGPIVDPEGVTGSITSGLGRIDGMLGMSSDEVMQEALRVVIESARFQEIEV